MQLVLKIKLARKKSFFPSAERLCLHPGPFVANHLLSEEKDLFSSLTRTNCLLSEKSR